MMNEEQTEQFEDLICNIMKNLGAIKHMCKDEGSNESINNAASMVAMIAHDKQPGNLPLLTAMTVSIMVIKDT